MNYLSTKNSHLDNFLQKHKWVRVINWGTKEIDLTKVISIYSQAIKDGSSTEDSLFEAFPDDWEDIEICISDYPFLDCQALPSNKIKIWFEGIPFELE